MKPKLLELYMIFSKDSKVKKTIFFIYIALLSGNCSQWGPIANQGNNQNSYLQIIDKYSKRLFTNL